ncbi:hypothetical protein GJ744_001292 [Endocarpon pusillum]|uniref:Rhodopsin domain-containing protein n=1 Tax=Endocarpon pusillum TaxID=364733 RepID=A0A8H7AA93_9EURO|nr:hypothetical protein GJ744_001292 [Endocarpon pusillum]
MSESDLASNPIAPLIPLSSVNHSPWVVVGTDVLIIITLLVVTARVVARRRIVKTINWAEVTIIVATVIGLVQSICVNFACRNGLGRHRVNLEQPEFDRYSKYNYTGQILMIASLAFSKASVAFLVTNIQPAGLILRACHVFLATVLLWALAFILAISFQCSLPRPWDFSLDRCVCQHALHIALGVSNILTDLFLVVIPVPMVWPIQFSRAKRWLIISLFAFRITVPISTVFVLVSLSPYFGSYPIDKTWNSVFPTIANQIMMNLSITTACLPSLKRFLGELQTGLTALQIPQEVELSYSDSKAFGSKIRSNLTRDGYSTTYISGTEGSESMKGLTCDVIKEAIEYKVVHGEPSTSGSCSYGKEW